MIPQDIDWIIARAAQRKAPFPSAFMSSKPDAGINHKASIKMGDARGREGVGVGGTLIHVVNMLVTILNLCGAALE